MSEPELLIAREQVRAGLRGAVRRGEVERIRRGAYRRSPDDGPDRATGRDRWTALRGLHVDRARAVAAQLSSSHWFSHETAAVLHGLPVWRLPHQVHLVQHYRASARAAPDLRRHALPVEPGHGCERSGLAVTSLARTVADCVTTLPSLDGLVVADAGLRAGADPAEVARIVDDRYRGRARGLLVLELADAGAESAWETWVRYVAHWAGLPRPRTQVPVTTRRGRYRIDVGWEEHGVLVEFDGLVKYRDGALGDAHDADEARIAEKLRQDAVAEAVGVGLLRVTARDARDPQAVADRMLARFPAEIRRRACRNPLLPRPR
ncbi:hypothetical protein ACNHYB_11185 [Isoptericola jiangsuensis]|uniref:hypothetical protein n=1 Tax=Isoptericola jiangsuensis TaxID=548579 RepID=UPI003AAF3139